MKLKLSRDLLAEIHSHGQTAYPEEGAGLLLGRGNVSARTVEAILPLPNAREDGARGNRYLITPADMMAAEREAARRGLDIVGVFHSHPDHPDRPSEFDRQWALPWFSYVITRIDGGRAVSSRSWRLDEGRIDFHQEEIDLTN
jgi:proteasome lid subunit RPN8/RPN11